jgi:hypothetical protein
MIIKKNTYILLENFIFFYFRGLSVLLLIGNNGYFILKLPKFFLEKLEKNLISFIFLNKYHFISFLSIFKTFYNRLFFYYFFRLKLRGLGFRVKRMCKNLYRFYFINVNYIYLHVPLSIMVKQKKRKLFFLSKDFNVLQVMICHLLLIKAVTAYKRTGLIYPKMIIMMKPGKKRL